MANKKTVKDLQDEIRRKSEQRATDCYKEVQAALDKYGCAIEPTFTVSGMSGRFEAAINIIVKQE